MIEEPASYFDFDPVETPVETCEDVLAWMLENEEELYKRWPADVIYLMDGLAETIDYARGEFEPGATMDSRLAILKSLKSTERLIKEAMPDMKHWLRSPLNGVLAAVRDVMDAVTKETAAENANACAAAWLRSYTDDTGRTWRELKHIHLTNSRCYQAFVRRFPEETNPRWRLKQARAILERETAVSEEAS